MSKLNDIVKKHDAAQASKEPLQKEIDSLKKRKAELESQAEAAAEAGDEDRYIQLKHAADDAGMRAYVREKRLANADAPIDLAEGQAAWDEFISPINRQLNKAHAAYVKQQKQLFESLKELMELQRKAYATREQIAGLCGYKTWWVENDYAEVKSKFPFQHIDGLHADFRYFGDVGLVDRGVANGWGVMTNTEHTT